MSVVTTIARMKEMWQLIPGVVTAYKSIPRVILPAECPAVVFFPGEATFDLTTYGDNDGMETRVYRPTLFIRPAFMGIEEQVQEEVEPFFDRVRDYLLARPGLEIDGETEPGEAVYDAALLGEGGYQVIPYPSSANEVTDFAAIEWRHQVKEIFGITYRD